MVTDQTYSPLGIILESGSYNEILNKPGSELFNLITGNQPLSAQNGSRQASGSVTPVDTVVSEDIDLTAGPQSEKLRKKSHRQPSIISPEMQKQMNGQALAKTSNTIQKERSEQGEVKREVYKQVLITLFPRERRLTFVPAVLESLICLGRHLLYLHYDIAATILDLCV